MTYKTIIYCPDSHIKYNLRTLDRHGVGGGITARVRIGHALADLGNSVEAYVNCPRDELIRHVQYRHYSSLDRAAADVFIVSSSGGAFDLSGLEKIKVKAKLRILMVHGLVIPENIRFDQFDYIYFPSNFIRERLGEQISFDQGRCFVAYRGIVEEYYRKNFIQKRNPYHLVYTGHPSKGLEAAISIMRILRNEDSRFQLHIFGGNELWGEPGTETPSEPGIIHHGMIGQRRLARILQSIGFSLNLQAIQEGFGSAVSEALRAGCIVLASRVGAYPETIRNGWNGFFIPGDHQTEQTHQEAASLILRLIDHPAYMDFVRRNAIHTPVSWETIARAWVGHWRWHFNHPNGQQPNQKPNMDCALCHGKLIMLADGLHCVDCGNFQKYYDFSTS